MTGMRMVKPEDGGCRKMRPRWSPGFSRPLELSLLATFCSGRFIENRLKALLQHEFIIMYFRISLLVSFFLGQLLFASEKPHAVIVVGTHHYAPQRTMPLFAGELERLGFRATVINPDWDAEKDKRGLPGLVALADADVALFFVRFLKIEDQQLRHITDYLKSGKPVVGFRTSTHAFRYPSDHSGHDLNNGFGRDALGTPYSLHLAGGTQVEPMKGKADHPILTGVKAKEWSSPGTLYLADPQPGVDPFLVGTGKAKRTGKITNQFGTFDVQPTMTEPIAWTWKNKWGGRAFYTSLGHVGDFNEPNSIRVIVNGVFWAAGKEIPAADTEIKTLSASQPSKKKKPQAKKEPAPKPSPQVEPAAPKAAGKGTTLFYGNSFINRLQEEGTLEALLQAAESGKRLSFRSLAYPGDEVGFRIRAERFGDHLSFLTKQMPADRVVMCFGMNESFAGTEGLAKFSKDLRIYLSIIQARHPGAEYILVSPTAVENSKFGDFPDPSQRNEQIAVYTEAMKVAAREKGVRFVDLYQPSLELLTKSELPLTFNSLHFNSDGNQAIAKILAKELAPSSSVDAVQTDAPGFQALRKLVSRKVYEVATAYHPANGIHYYGVRQRSYEYQTEIPHHLKLTGILDKAIWKQAANLKKVQPFPELPTTQAEPPARPPRRGLGTIKTSKEDLADFTVAEGFEVNLFASSEDFPELINPLQINFDSRGRLWAACFASYPVPVPGTLSDDKILIFEDTDGDGKADKRIVFADQLKLPDGFVFYKDGIIASVANQLLWLRDTDGDDVADVREEFLCGLDDTDTHHGGYLARTPQGHIVYCEGLFHRGQFETPHGPVRTKDATALFLDPQTRSLSIERQTTHPNPWKISYNGWGESIQMFGGGQIIDCDFYNVWTPTGIGVSLGMPFRDDKGCTLAHVSSPHFPNEMQGGLVTGHLLGKNTVLYTPIEIRNGTYTKGGDSWPLLTSPNKSFRPTDLTFGLDGALYISDFYYPIIGHAQHSIRDSNRDYSNGRIWRLTNKGVDPAKPPTIHGAPLEKLFQLLIHPQDRVRELAREELERRPTEEVLKLAKAKARQARVNELLELELLWLFERFKDFSQTDLFQRLAKSDYPEYRQAAARSLRWWAPALGESGKQLADALWETGDLRTQIGILSSASHLQHQDLAWRQYIDNVGRGSTNMHRVATQAKKYNTPPISPEFPLLKVHPDANLKGWLVSGNKAEGSIVVKSPIAQDLILGFRGNSEMNLNVNNIPLHRAAGSLHTRNGQVYVSLESGLNKLEYFTKADHRGRPGRIDLYLSNLIGGKPEPLNFPKDEAQHLKWTAEYDAANATVTDTTIRLKAIPAKMAFNVTEIHVEAGHTYQFIFENPDHMLHNVVISQPGKANAVGELADAMAAHPDGMAKHFVPESDLVLFSTPQIPHGGKFEKSFTTPKEHGSYPILCTFPGHWRLMSGVMVVGAPKPKTELKTAAPKPVQTTGAPAVALTTTEGFTIELANVSEDFQNLVPKGMPGVKVTTNHKTANEPVSILTDGKLSTDFGPIFKNGVRNGAYKMDLGSAKPIKQITTWSHNAAGRRGIQRIEIYGSASSNDPGWDTTDSVKFTKLGSIDTSKQATANFTATSLISNDNQSLGTFRWIIWRTHPYGQHQENTAFQELGVEFAK